MVGLCFIYSFLKIALSVKYLISLLDFSFIGTSCCFSKWLLKEIGFKANEPSQKNITKAQMANLWYKASSNNLCLCLELPGIFFLMCREIEELIYLPQVLQCRYPNNNNNNSSNHYHSVSFSRNPIMIVSFNEGRVALEYPHFCLEGAQFLNLNISELQFWISYAFISYIMLSKLFNSTEPKFSLPNKWRK